MDAPIVARVDIVGHRQIEVGEGFVRERQARHQAHFFQCSRVLARYVHELRLGEAKGHEHAS